MDINLTSLELELASRYLLAIPIMAALALVVDIMWQRGLLRLARQTASMLDDQMLVLLRRPVTGSMVLAGFGYALAHAELVAPNDYLVRATLLSFATILWTTASMRMARVGLDYLTVNQESLRIVQPRTLPIFQIGARIVIVGGGLYFLLLSWDINVSGWIASAGIVGVAIAYAAQDTLANLFAGFTILTDAPYKLDDYLVLDNGLQGRVTHIGFRSTRILTLEHVEVIIPNAAMATSMITNMSGGPRTHARLDVPVGVAYGSDVDEVRALLLVVAASLQRVIIDEADDLISEVHFVAMGASSLDFVLRVWLTDPGDHARVRDEANTLIYKSLVAADIEIPYPKQDVYLHTP
jgi:MscS family membrane protein